MTASLPPYPRLGEIYRQLALALDTKAKNTTLDSLARKGDYDWVELQKLGEELVNAPLEKYTDTVFAATVSQFVGQVHADYPKLVLAVSLDGLSREDALPLLVEHYFSLHGSELIAHLHKKFTGPDLSALFAPERHPVEVVLDWLGEGDSNSLAKAAYQKSTDGDKTNRDMVDRWKRGSHAPDIGSIHRFCSALTAHDYDTVHLRRWLLIARALSMLEKNSPIPLRQVMRNHHTAGRPLVDIGAVLTKAVQLAGKKLSALSLPVRLLHDNLKRTTAKAPGDQAQTQAELVSLGALFATHDPEERTWFHIEWLRGRWQALSGDFEQALLHYKEAVTRSNYRGGDGEKDIMKEALVIAGYLGKRTFLKQLKHRAIAFGLLQNPEGQVKVIADWEISRLKQQFHELFPAIGRFPEIAEGVIDSPQLPFLVFDLEKMAEKRVDLRSPDRICSASSQDGQTRHWSQLRLFASIGRVDEVKKLLAAEADVNYLDESNGSALLCAIQHAMQTGERSAMNLLLQHKHAKSTLDKATTKKQLTPLIVAVEHGDADVVAQLLCMGATADQQGNFPNETTLYLCMKNLGALLQPKKFCAIVENSLFADPNSVQREALRRYSVTSAGVFGENRTLLQQKMALLIPTLARGIFQEKISPLTLPNLLKIAELLLQHGANANAPHTYPTPGRTPLMLAAENNSRDAFELLLKHGGHPLAKDKQGHDSCQIAWSFQSHAVIASLRQSGLECGP